MKCDNGALADHSLAFDIGKLQAIGGIPGVRGFLFCLMEYCAIGLDH